MTDVCKTLAQLARMRFDHNGRDSVAGGGGGPGVFHAV